MKIHWDSTLMIDLVRVMKYVNESWLEPGISTRVAMPLTQLDCVALALCQHPTPLGTFWRAFWEAEQLPTWQKCSTAPLGLGESEAGQVSLSWPPWDSKHPLPQHWISALSKEVHGWSFLDPVGYLEEKTRVACSPSGCVEATAPGQEARPLSSPASSWPGHLFRFPGPQLL